MNVIRPSALLKVLSCLGIVAASACGPRPPVARPETVKSECERWQEGERPHAQDGWFFDACSDWLETEGEAVEQALKRARRRVTSVITQGGVEGILLTVMPECKKLESMQGPDSWRYKATVLVFVSKRDLRAAIDKIEEEAPRDPDLKKRAGELLETLEKLMEKSRKKP